MKNANFIKRKSLITGITISLFLLIWIIFAEDVRKVLFSMGGVSNDQQVQLGDENIVTKLGPSEFSKLIQDENVFVLDVHTPEQTHIPGTDELIPFDQIEENIDKLPTDKSTPIAVYCRSGSMSGISTKELSRLGYTNVYDLEGGTNAYKEQQVSVSLLPAKIDLGTVIYGDVATTSFTFTNYMPLPISITRVSTSCGCTKASAEKESLGAYESTTVNVSFDPAVHKDDTDLGELTRTIYIQTDRDDYKELEVTISANVIKK